ncbi:hypothetical protein ON010_g14883 [Phytophthora cinnamomi]|nr:hypothetical protein ON010_g14883 [Phytophthora cinnamomi]
MIRLSRKYTGEASKWPSTGSISRPLRQADLGLLLGDAAVHRLGRDLGQLVRQREHPKGCGEVHHVAEAQHSGDTSLGRRCDVQRDVDAELVQFTRPQATQRVEPQVDEEGEEEAAHAGHAEVPVPEQLVGDEARRHAGQGHAGHGHGRPDHFRNGLCRSSGGLIPPGWSWRLSSVAKRSFTDSEVGYQKECS